MLTVLETAPEDQDGGVVCINVSKKGVRVLGPFCLRQLCRIRQLLRLANWE